jgi:hypothetical protein
MGFLEREFERDHLAEKSKWTKMGQKIHCAEFVEITRARFEKNSKSQP